jgi:hypothetical protein
MGSHKLDNELFKQNFEVFLTPETFKEFSDLLYKHNAILAGGAPLAIFHGDFVRDLDIYVQLKNAQAFFFELTFLLPISQTSYGYKYNSYLGSTGHLVPPYDQSFLAKNNIIGRISNTHYHTRTGIRGRNTGRFLMIDLQVVSDHINLIDVPKNFDLTFCMIWYNGKDLFAAHPDDVKNKKGTLEPPYFKALLQGNTFTIKRMKKYTDRGYVIKYPNINTREIEMTFTIKSKKVISPERWLTERLMDKVIQYIANSKSSGFNEHFNIVILLLDMMKKSELGEDSTRNLSPDDLFKFSNFVTIFTEIYSPIVTKLNEELDVSVYGTFTWSINYLIYTLLCAKMTIIGSHAENYHSYMSGIQACHYKEPWSKYITDVSGIVVKGENPHGFDGEIVPLCEGETPPFSKGINGIPSDINYDDMWTLIKNGLKSLTLNNESLQRLLESKYPELKPPQPPTAAERFAAARARDQERAAALRQRQIEEGTVIEEAEEEEEAEGEYTLPGTDREVPARCFSEVDGGDINTQTWYPTPGTILLLIEFAPGLDPDLVCTSVQELNRRLRDNANILYQCVVPDGGRVYFPPGEAGLLRMEDLGPHDPYDIRTEDVDRSVEYIPFTYAVDERGSTRGYLPRSSVERIVASTETEGNARVFVLKFDGSMSHTYNKVGSGNLGSNHCQAGSTVLLFRVEDYGDESGVATAVDSLDRQVELTEAVTRAQDAYNLVHGEVMEAQRVLQEIENTVAHWQAERGGAVPADLFEAIQEEWAAAAGARGVAEQNLEVAQANLTQAQEELRASQTEVEAAPPSPLVPRELFPGEVEGDLDD